jgi:pyrroline-5-carboxylate reductase
LAEGIHVTDEKYFGLAAALNGSDAAYVFLLIEALVNAVVHIGLPRGMAQELVMQNIVGSSAAVEKRYEHPAHLRNMVTSPENTEFFN